MIPWFCLPNSALQLTKDAIAIVNVRGLIEMRAYDCDRGGVVLVPRNTEFFMHIMFDKNLLI